MYFRLLEPQSSKNYLGKESSGPIIRCLMFVVLYCIKIKTAGIIVGVFEACLLRIV